MRRNWGVSRAFSFAGDDSVLDGLDDPRHSVGGREDHHDEEDLLEVGPPGWSGLPRGGGAGDQHTHASAEDCQNDPLWQAQVPTEEAQVLITPSQLSHDDREDHGDQDADQEACGCVSEDRQQVQGNFGSGVVGGQHADNRSR